MTNTKSGSSSSLDKTMAKKLQNWNKINNSSFADELALFASLGGIRVVYNHHATLAVIIAGNTTVVGSKADEFLKPAKPGLYNRVYDRPILPDSGNYFDNATGQPIDPADILTQGKGDILDATGAVVLERSVYKAPSFKLMTRTLPAEPPSWTAFTKALLLAHVAENSEDAIVITEESIEDLLAGQLSIEGNVLWDQHKNNQSADEAMQYFGVSLPHAPRVSINKFFETHGYKGLYSVEFDQSIMRLNFHCDLGTYLWASGLERKLAQGVVMSSDEAAAISNETMVALGLQKLDSGSDVTLSF